MAVAVQLTHPQGLYTDGRCGYALSSCASGKKGNDACLQQAFLLCSQPPVQLAFCVHSVKSLAVWEARV